MTPAEIDEVVGDLLTATLPGVAAAVAGEHVDVPTPELADRIVASLSDDDARSVLLAMTALASVLLEATSQHTGNAPEDIIVTLREEML